jgi:hypothetical protein
VKGRVAVHLVAVVAAGALAVAPVGASGALAHRPGPAARAAVAHASTLNLCRRRAGHYLYPSRVSGLTVVRSRPLNHESFTFPAVVHSTRVGAIRRLARALCDLPPASRVAAFCPADLGVDYTLTFVVGGGGPASGTALRPVVVHATGCATVTGLTPTRWAIGRPGFFGTFGAAIGLAHATRDTFAGTLAS